MPGLSTVAWGNSAAAGVMTNELTQIAPLATSLHGPNPGGSDLTQVVNSPSKVGPSALSGLVSKAESIGKESVHMVGDVGEWAGKQLAQGAVGTGKFVYGINKMAYVDTYQLHTENMATNQLNEQLKTLQSQYKSGQINGTEYKAGLKDVNNGFIKLTASVKDTSKNVQIDTQEVKANAINTISTVLTVMTAGAFGIGAKAVDAGVTATTDFLGSTAAKGAMDPVEQSIGRLALNQDVFSKLPEGMQAAIQDTTNTVLSQSSNTMTAGKIARATASALLLKYPLTFNAISGTGNQVLKELQQDKYGDATKTLAFNAALIMSGGPIGHALEAVGKGLTAAKIATFGAPSFIDSLSSITSDAKASGIAEALKNAGPDVTRSWSALEATNMAATKGDALAAAQRVAIGFETAGWDLRAMTHDQIVQDGHNWAVAQKQLIDHLMSNGMTEQEASRYTVGRWTINDSKYVGDKVFTGDNGEKIPKDQMLQNWETLKAQNTYASWANNANIDQLVKTTIANNRGAKSMQAAINDVEKQYGFSTFGEHPSGLVSKKVEKSLGKLGFTVIKPVNLEAPFKAGAGTVTSKFAEGSDFFLKATEPLPVLGHMGTLLTKAGLSPNNASTRVFQIFNQNLADRLEGTTIKNSDLVSKKLANYVRDMPTSIKHPPITDYRQMSLQDIQLALGVTKNEAHQVQQAITESMLKVPLQIRGLGDHIQDINYRFNPAAKYYSRLQGATRFAWNPFFQMRLSYKAEFLSQFEAGGKFPTIAGTNTMLKMIMPEKYNQLDSVTSLLEKNGMFGAGFSAEGADDTAAGYNQLKQQYGHILPGQKRSVAGLVSVMSDRVGMTPEQFVQAFPQETKDTVKMILQYDPRANFLNSPMARTLNMAFFPFRFNLKVTTIMARSLARQSLGVQFATIKGMMSAHSYLNSPEGQAWYSNNSDVIGLFKYFSPLETISSISQALTTRPGSFGAYGELGGLPFGFIPGLLNSEGLMDTGTPYVNPTTGAIAQNYVPISSRGRAQAAIEDFLGAIYSYPGSELGLPSKSKVDVTMAKWLTPGGSSATDFATSTPQLTPQQQQFQQVVQQLHPPTAGAPDPNKAILQGTQGYQSNPPSPGAGTNVPSQGSSLTALHPNASSSKAPKLKKGQRIPQMLPGQTQLGVLPQQP